MQASKNAAFISLWALSLCGACADQPSPLREEGDGGVAGMKPGDPCRPNGTCDDGLECDQTTKKCAAQPGTFDDCRDLGRSCLDPYECLEDEAGRYACGFPAAGPVTCRGTPAGQLVPFATTTGGQDGFTLHWPLAGGCIPITYAQGLVHWSGILAESAKIWTDVDCARVCFSTTTEAVTAFLPERGDRRVHVLLGATGTPPAVTNLFFEEENGRIIAAEIKIDPARIDTLEGRDVLRLLGLALGLQTAPGASVMAEDRKAVTYTRDDSIALCALYGATPYCGE